MNKITNADLTPILSADDPEFRVLVERFDPKCWAKYDLSAMRVGYHYGREPLLARLAMAEDAARKGDEARRNAAAFKLRIADLEGENSALSAGACCVKWGLVGDDHGNAYCTLQHQIKQAEEQRNYLVEVLRQFAQADLNETNCASLEVASRRIRYLAQAAIDHVNKEPK